MGIVQEYFKSLKIYSGALGDTEEKCLDSLIESHSYLRERNNKFTKLTNKIRRHWYLQYLLKKYI
jgi:hypothetical protein